MPKKAIVAAAEVTPPFPDVVDKHGLLSKEGLAGARATGGDPSGKALITSEPDAVPRHELAGVTEHVAAFAQKPKPRDYEGVKIVRVRFARQVDIANEYVEFISERTPGFHLDLRGPLLWIRKSRAGAADEVAVVPITTILWMKAAEGE